MICKKEGDRFLGEAPLLSKQLFLNSLITERLLY